jgi:hypothetical protein
MTPFNTFVGTTFSRGVVEYEARKNQLPAQLQDDLFGPVKRQHLVNAQYYSACIMNTGTSTKSLFKTGNSKSYTATGASDVNPGNLKDGQPDPGDFLLILGIQLLYSATGSTLNADAWGELSAVLLNGEIDIDQDGRTILPKNTPNQIFDGTNKERMLGYHALENPIFLVPQKQINVYLTASAATASNAAVKLIFWGVKNAKL